MTVNEPLDRDELPFDEWAVTPDPDDLIPDSIEHERESEWFREQLAGNDDPRQVSEGPVAEHRTQHFLRRQGA